MISVIMPYWEYQDLLDACLVRMSHIYNGYDLEVIVVDDGSSSPYSVAGNYSWPIHVIRLPRQEKRMNLCSAFNAGAEASQSNTLMLVDLGVIFRGDILREMQKELASAGSRGFVTTAVWGIEENTWLCHESKKSSLPLPRGASIPYCSLIYKEHFNRVGGFSEAYRNGKDYEAVDIVMKLFNKDTIFRFRSDLAVNYHSNQRGWSIGAEDRNSEIYRRKWCPILR